MIKKNFDIETWYFTPPATSDDVVSKTQHRKLPLDVATHQLRICVILRTHTKCWYHTTSFYNSIGQ